MKILLGSWLVGKAPLRALYSFALTGDLVYVLTALAAYPAAVPLGGAWRDAKDAWATYRRREKRREHLRLVFARQRFGGEVGARAWTFYIWHVATFRSLPRPLAIGYSIYAVSIMTYVVIDSLPL